MEAYQSNSKILAGLYIAPAGAGTGQMYLLQLPGNTTVIGPESAISAAATDPTIGGLKTLHQDWAIGNILLYSINDRFTYIIPYYGTQSNLNVPVMVVAVDGPTKQVASYLINNPNNSTEVQGAANAAVEKLALSPPPPPPPPAVINGTVANPVRSYTANGNTQWIVDINNGTSIITVYGSADRLSQTDVNKILQLTPGVMISVQVDSNKNIIKILQP